MRRAIGIIVGGLAAALLLACAAWWLARPAVPGDFYEASLPTETAAGALLRVEPFGRGVPPGARGWRLLYATTLGDGATALASAIVVAPDGAGPFRAVGYAHGTTGVSRGCAPSLLDDPFANVPGFPALLDEGWAYVATDYQGLGTPGRHRYLVGEDAARAVLDALRAARGLPGLALAPGAVVWGHSQGGHAALWTGRIAPDYAPELALLGVAAVSPASDLPALVEASKGSVFGKIVSAYLVSGYDAAYPEAAPWNHVVPSARLAARDIAARCVEGPAALVSVAETLAVPGGGLFARPANEGVFGERLRQNVPTGPFAAPVLIAQGVSDDLVPIEIQDGFAARLCERGVALHYARYEGEDHLSIVEPASPLTAELVDWTAGRFSGEPAAPTCGR